MPGIGDFIKEHASKDGGFFENDETSDIQSTRYTYLKE